MDREELLDNLAESSRRGERVTLVLRPVSGVRGDQTVTGYAVAVAEHYTGRFSWQFVLDRRPDHPHLVVGLTMIKDFRVGN